MKRIFLVDNDRGARRAIRCALERQDFEVRDFPSPTEALAAILTDPPDLLIAEVNTPGMTGFDLAATVQDEAAPGLPVILVTPRPTLDLTSKADAMGIRYVLDKQTEGVSELSSAVRRELFWVEATDMVRRLDDLRTEFLVDLSHQLRTPMTAMKLALDGLFSQLHEVMDASQRSMAKITCRNIERVVALVENQLNMLQLMTGERPLCRRLVDLEGLVRSLPRYSASDRGEADGPDVESSPSVVITRCARNGAESREPLYAFTDPELVSAIVDYVLSVGQTSARRAIRLDYDPVNESCQLELYVDSACERASMGETAPVRPQPCGKTSEFDFEYRAYRTLIKELGGDVAMEKDDNHKRIRIRLPRYPQYDRNKDFLEPVRYLRSVGGADTGSLPVHFVRCDLGERSNSDYLSAEDPIMRRFFERVGAVLSEGDAVIRGRQQGTIYLALLGRSENELEHIVGFLGRENGDGSSGASHEKPYVCKPQSIVDDQREIDLLVNHLELVRK